VSESKFKLMVDVTAYDVAMWDVINYLKGICPDVGKGEFEVTNVRYWSSGADE
jgi:hypothetical protein